MTTGRRPAATAVTVLALLTTLLLAVPVAAEDVEDELASVTSRISDVASQIEASKADRSEIANDIIATTERMEALLDDLAEARASVLEVQLEIDDRRKALNKVQDDLQRQYEKLVETRHRLTTDRDLAIAFVRESYMTAGNGLAEMAFAADDFMSMTLSLEYIGRAADQSEASVARLEALQKQEERQQALIEQQELAVEQELQVLALREERLAELRDQIAADTAAVEAELVVQRNLLDEVQHEIEHFEGELEALAGEQDRLEQLIKDRQAQAAAAPAPPATSDSGFVRPVPGAITSGFGPRRHPILGTTRLHTGVDMTASSGTKIKAADGGTVILAGYYGGYGNTVIIDHGGGVATLYAHQSKLGVDDGETVDAGEVIGYVGSTGLSTGPHLHFEVRVNGNPVDPANYL